MGYAGAMGGIVLWGTLGLACSSDGLPRGTGGGSGGSGGSPGGATGGVAGGTGGAGGALLSPGACSPGITNPDYAPGGACEPSCQSISCGRACTMDCCVPCGIGGLGRKVCTCPTPGGPYSNCTCQTSEPSGAGPCLPQGYSTAAVPVGAPAGSISLNGLPCTKLYVVCFTADSTDTGQRACICADDGVLHRSGLSHAIPNTGIPTPYN